MHYDRKVCSRCRTAAEAVGTDRLATDGTSNSVENTAAGLFAVAESAVLVAAAVVAASSNLADAA